MKTSHQCLNISLCFNKNYVAHIAFWNAFSIMWQLREVNYGGANLVLTVGQYIKKKEQYHLYSRKNISATIEKSFYKDLTSHGKFQHEVAFPQQRGFRWQMVQPATPTGTFLRHEHRCRYNSTANLMLLCPLF